MTFYSVYQRRIDVKSPPALVASGLSWERVVSYLTATHETKSGHGLHAWVDGQSVTVPWFSRMVYDIIPDKRG